MKVKKFQEGGMAPAPAEQGAPQEAQMAQGQGDPQQQLMGLAQEIIQQMGPEAAMMLAQIIMEMVLLTALGVGGATIFGSCVGFMFKKLSHKFSDIVLSFAAGVMLAAAVFGLVMPSLEFGGEWGLLVTISGIFAGAVCMNFIDKLVPHLHKLMGVDEEKHPSANLNKVLLFVLAIGIHNLPEGIAAGVGFGSGNVTQAFIIAGGIALPSPSSVTVPTPAA